MIHNRSIYCKKRLFLGHFGPKGPPVAENLWGGTGGEPPPPHSAGRGTLPPRGAGRPSLLSIILYYPAPPKITSLLFVNAMHLKLLWESFHQRTDSRTNLQIFIPRTTSPGNCNIFTLPQWRFIHS